MTHRTRWLASIGLAVVAAAVPLSPAIAEEYETKTRAEYISEVDPLCKQGDRRTSRAIRGYGDAIDAGRFKKAARILLRAVRVFARSVEEVSAVEPPAEDVELIESWLELERKDIAVTRRIARAWRAERFRRVKRGVKRSRAIERKIDRLIGDYGFRHCN